MPRRLLTSLAALWLTTAVSAAAQASADSASGLLQARQFTEWFYTGQKDSVWAHLDDASRQEVGTPADLARQLDQATRQVGSEMDVVEENLRVADGKTIYNRLAKFSRSDEPIVLQWVFTRGGQITSFGLSPESPAGKR